MSDPRAACPGPASIVFSPDLTEYDFGPTHPMSPLRIDLTMRLADEIGVLATPASPAGGGRLLTVPAPMADLDTLATVHDESYIEAVMKAGAHGVDDPAHGLGTDDDPVFAHMHEASAHIVGATVEACRRVWQGEALHAANIIGGLHHAMRDRASGFCIYNDVAAGIQWLLDHGAQRVAYVDVDVHHGDGVERAFWNDPRVLTVSLHETGQLLFPGTGFATEVGGPDAAGTAVNVALPPGTADAGWLRAFHAVVPELVRSFEPEILITQQGCDSHFEDPLAHLMLSVDGQRASYLALHDLAHEVADGKWVALGGGGYAITDVVPRAWTHLLAIVAGEPLDPTLEIPGGWREHVEQRYGRIAPGWMTDGRTPFWRDWREGYDPDAWLDRQVHETRQAVFPLHGLDPSAW